STLSLTKTGSCSQSWLVICSSQRPPHAAAHAHRPGACARLVRAGAGGGEQLDPDTEAEAAGGRPAKHSQAAREAVAHEIGLMARRGAVDAEPHCLDYEMVWYATSMPGSAQSTACESDGDRVTAPGP